MNRISRHPRFTVRLPMITVAALALLWSSAVPAADVDLATSIVSAPAIADPGQTVEYTVAYSNNSAADATDARLRLILPPGLFLDWSTAEIEGVESSFSDTGGNQVSISIDDFSCDHMLVNVIHDGSDAPVIPADTSDQFSIAVPLPEEIPTVGSFVVHAPASLARIYEYAYGVCDTCSDLSTCFGGPLSTMAPVTADLELVNDPAPEEDQTPDMGCNQLDGFTTGNIAIVRRGGCGFGVKALNAESAGASGVVIVNSTAGGNIHTIGMNGGDEGALVTIPVVMISREDGDALISELGSTDAAVTASLGGIESEDLLLVSTAFLTMASPDADPDDSNDSDSTVTIVDYITDEPPEAAFTYSPTVPAKGQAVQFTDVSANEPTAWEWDFGDDVGTSSDQNPTYAFADAGVYTVTLTATNEFGSGTTTVDVTVGQLIQITNQYFIPAAAFAEGIAGAFFETDVEINNVGPTAMEYQFVWLPRGEDNSSFLTSSAFRLEPNTSARYENAVNSLFGLEDGLGAIGVVADSPNALLMSRTFNRPEGDGAGTFGQSIPGIALTDMTAEGVTERILFMSENSAFRANVGCQNGVGTNIRIRLELFSADGTSLEVRNMDLQPWSNSQFSRIFLDHQPVDVGFVDVQSSTPGARFLCYGSVLDAETSDPTTILPQ
jgi:uncharacterized repeat protein (TIGR01451 family)